MAITKRLYLTDLGTDTKYTDDRTDYVTYRAELLGLMHDALKTDESSSKYIINGAYTDGTGVNKNIVLGMIEIFNILKDSNAIALTVKNSAHSRGAVQSIIRTNEIQKIIHALDGVDIYSLTTDQMKNILFQSTKNDRRLKRFASEYDDRYNEEQLRNILINIQNIKIDQYLIDPVPGGSVIWWKDEDMHDIPPVVNNCHIRWYQDERSVGFEALVPNLVDPSKTNYVSDTLPGHHGTGSGNLGAQDDPSYEKNTTEASAKEWDKVEGVYILVAYQLIRFFSDWHDSIDCFDLNDGQYHSNKNFLHQIMTEYFSAEPEQRTEIIKQTYRSIAQSLEHYRKFRKTSYYRGYLTHATRPARHAANKLAPDQYSELTDIAICVEELQGATDKAVNLEHLMLTVEGTLFERSQSIEALFHDIQQELSKPASPRGGGAPLTSQQINDNDVEHRLSEKQRKLIEFKTNRLIMAALKQQVPLTEIIKMTQVAPNENAAGTPQDADLSESQEDMVAVLHGVPAISSMYPTIFMNQFQKLASAEVTLYTKMIADAHQATANSLRAKNGLCDIKPFLCSLLSLKASYDAYTHWHASLVKSVTGAVDYESIVNKLETNAFKRTLVDTKAMLVEHDWIIRQKTELDLQKENILSLQHALKAQSEEHSNYIQSLDGQIARLESQLAQEINLATQTLEQVNTLNESNTQFQSNIADLTTRVEAAEASNRVLHYRYSTLKQSASASVLLTASSIAVTVFATTFPPALIALIALGVAIAAFLAVQGVRSYSEQAKCSNSPAMAV